MTEACIVGWAHSPFGKLEDPDIESLIGRVAGAAIEDAGHVERSVAHNEKWLAWLTGEITKLGLTVTPSVTNFVLIHFPDTKGHTAKDADAFLTARGLILRQTTAYKLPNALRMTVGTEEANRAVVAALKDFLGR